MSASMTGSVNTSFAAASDYKKYTLLLAVVGGVLSGMGFLVDKTQFYVSYLEGFLWVSAIPMGCFGLLMIHTMVGGNWGWTIRPFLVSGAKTIPIVALLFIPVALGMHEIYPWTNPAYVEHDHVMQTKVSYLNAQFWSARAVFYWVAWVLWSALLIRLLVTEPSKLSDKKALHRAQRVASTGILFFMLSVSFAGIDWVMSIEPQWFSSVFGALIVVGQAMSAFGFCTWCLIAMDRKSPNMWMTQKNVHDLGKFMFMTVMLWGYLSLSQYLITWAGNLPEETFWYHERSLGTWSLVSAALVFFQFVVPFCWLLSKHVKRNVRVLPWIISLLFVVRWLEQLWLVKPGLLAGRFPFHWMDLSLPLLIGSVWAFFYFTFLSRAASVPAPAGGFGHGHGPAAPQDQPTKRKA